MPNWCNNVATLRHDDPAMIGRVCAAFRAGELLQEFIPCPQVLRDTQSVYYPDSMPEKQAEQAAIEAENIKNHGYANWYDWQIANWGTKWDIGGDTEITDFSDNHAVLAFDSAWAPPRGAYWALEEQGFEIEAFYYEPGMAFCGSWINGIEAEYQIPDTAQEADQVIPEEIDEVFDIVNSMATWEEDDVEAE
jgi:hypothetical protein